METSESRWAELIERAKTRRSIPSDSELARRLRTGRQSINDIRSGRQEVPIELRLQILDLADEPISEDEYVLLLPKKAREEYRSKIGVIFEPETGREMTPDFWLVCFKKLHKFYGVDTDAEMASGLGVSPTVISVVRSGVGVLSPGLKIKILDKLGYAAARSLLLNLLPRRASKKFEAYDNLRFKKRGKTVPPSN